ncbi:Scramblase, partial [Oesophagostomum dentatum]
TLVNSPTVTYNFFFQEVLLIRRSFSCWGDGFCGLFASISCCATKCTVESPPGNVIGTIEQQWAFCASVLKIRDIDDQEILRVKGSCSCLQCKCLEKEFAILNPAGEEIGNIKKKGARSALTFLGANFDVQAKALLLGAKFLIEPSHPCSLKGRLMESSFEPAWPTAKHISYVYNDDTLWT